LDTADGVLDLPCGLVTLAVSSQFRVTDALAGRLLDRARGLLSYTSDTILIHAAISASSCPRGQFLGPMSRDRSCFRLNA
jgi:hypothetical protein